MDSVQLGEKSLVRNRRNATDARVNLPISKNVKRIALYVALGLIVAIAGTVIYLRGRRYVVTITQAQIDQTLQAKFPVTKKHLLLFNVTYSNPRVRLLPGTNRIEVGMDAVLNMRIFNESKQLGGSAVLTTGLAYRNETKQFFLSDPKIDKLSIQGIPEQYLAKVTEFASKAAGEHLEEIPVYTLKAKDIKTTAAKLLLKDLQVKGSEIHATLGL